MRKRDNRGVRKCGDTEEGESPITPFDGDETNISSSDHFLSSRTTMTNLQAVSNTLGVPSEIARCWASFMTTVPISSVFK